MPRGNLELGLATCLMGYKKRARYPFYLIIGGFWVLVLSLISYQLWTPGRDVRDGSHDIKRNGIWIQHGWLGDNRWFYKNKKEERVAYFRDPDQIRNLALLLKQHHITDVFPHLCPTSSSGEISSVDPHQTELFWGIFDSFRVAPWVGGVLGVHAFPENPEWRRSFVESIQILMMTYPKFSGVHINIEPCPSGHKGFLMLLEDVRKVLPKGKMLSVAAFPPPTRWHPFREVHWDSAYYKQVAQRSDQIVVMMYDTAIRFKKVYQNLLSAWTREVLDWSKGTEVLFGLPAYRDEGVAYHIPKVENLENALLGVHSGLSNNRILPENYQGVAIYCEWEMDADRWEILRTRFLTSK